MPSPPLVSPDELCRYLPGRALASPQDLSTYAHVFADVKALYENLAADLPPLGGHCQRRGHCCRFAEFGHRLYLTTPEWLYMLAGLTAQQRRDLAAASLPATQCPFLTTATDGRPLCGHHEHRAIGCRIFYCEAQSPPPAFHDLYEVYHARMTALAERYGLPYSYRELLSALADVPATLDHFANPLPSPPAVGQTSPPSSIPLTDLNPWDSNST